ncbi:MAG: pyruvate synthase [Desulfobulbaceae bacterium]|nr:MAG: pyruvate synthase [Desulfobulbaceae bacterium]
MSSAPQKPSSQPLGHQLAAGTSTCAGCGALQGIRLVHDILDSKVFFVNAAGCMTLLSIYPFTPFAGAWLYTSMASAAAGGQGVRDALDIMLAGKRLPPQEDMQVVVLSGDGSAGGMGLSATSGAMDRNLDFIYLCYDNEGYGNTGYQLSAATPHGARTTTSTSGNPGYKKELFDIWTAHKPAYAATICGAEPGDLRKKVETLKGIKGPRLLLALSPCPTAWHFEPADTITLGKLAVACGLWPLKEYKEGRLVHTKVPKKTGRRPQVEEYLRLQGRYRHLFAPRRNDRVISEIQNRVDRYWEKVTDEG